MSVKVRDKLLPFVPVIVIILLAFIILLPQFYTGFLPMGSDITFHYNRFYDIYQQIETGKFNYYQSIYGFNGSGRIINALYGYDTAFFHGFLLWVTKSWFSMQILSSLTCLLSAGFGMYVLMKRLKVTTLFSVIGAGMYMSSAPILYYIKAIGFSGFGASVLPWIFIPAVRVIQNKNKPINPVYLGLIMSLIFNTHMLSAALAVLAIVPFFIVGFIQTKQKKQFMIDLALSVLLFIVLSLNTIVAYMDVFLSNNMLQPFIPKLFIKNTIKMSTASDYGNTNIGLLFGLLFLFQIAYVAVNHSKVSLIEKIMTSVGAVFLIVSSSFVPWDILVKQFSMLTIFQFAFRFAAISYILLIASFMLTMTRLSRLKPDQSGQIVKVIVLTLGLLLLMQSNERMTQSAIKWHDDPVSMGNNKNNMIEQSKKVIREKLSSSNLTEVFDLVAKGTPDYLPIKEQYDSVYVHKNFSPYKLYLAEVFHNQAGFEQEVLDDGRVKLTWNSESKGDKQLPLIIYNHTTVEKDGEVLSRDGFKTSDIGSLIVEEKIGENTVITGYEPLLNMTVVLLIKGLGFVFVFIYCGMRIKHYIITQKEANYAT